MDTKEKEVIDLLINATVRIIDHAHNKVDLMYCPVCADVMEMVRMAKRLMEES